MTSRALNSSTSCLKQVHAVTLAPITSSQASGFLATNEEKRLIESREIRVIKQ